MIPERLLDRVCLPSIELNEGRPLLVPNISVSAASVLTKLWPIASSSGQAMGAFDLPKVVPLKRRPDTYLCIRQDVQEQGSESVPGAIEHRAAQSLRGRDAPLNRPQDGVQRDVDGSSIAVVEHRDFDSTSRGKCGRVRRISRAPSAVNRQARLRLHPFGMRVRNMDDRRLAVHRSGEPERRTMTGHHTGPGIPSASS